MEAWSHTQVKYLIHDVVNMLLSPFDRRSVTRHTIHTYSLLGGVSLT